MTTKKTLGQIAFETVVGRLQWHKQSARTKQEWKDFANRSLSQEYRTMRSLLLRLHSARVAMNEAAVVAALDDVDAFFREENTN